MRKKDGELCVRPISARYRREGAKPLKKPFPSFDSHEKLEAFLDTADLDAYDLAAGALPRDDWFARYEQFAKYASIHLRLPGGLLDTVRSQGLTEPSRPAPHPCRQQTDANFGR